MPITFAPLPFSVSMDSIKLGSFITNLSNPHENRHEASNITPTCLITDLPVSTYEQGKSSQSLGSALLSLLSTTLSRQTESFVSLTTPVSVRNYVLDKSEPWFDQVIQADETKGGWKKGASAGKRYIWLWVSKL